MTDLEIDKALAIAIGWDQALRSSQGIVVQTHREHDRVKSNGRWLYHWRVFSHKDWNVIGPIAERYNCFPYKLRGIECHGGWNVLSGGKDFTDISPQRAIALAVIGGAK